MEFRIQLCFLLILAALLCGNRATFADPPVPPTEFVGLKWGISKEEAKGAMKEKKANAMPRFTTDTHLAFSGGEAASIPVEYWDLFFGGDKFLRGLITFKAVPDTDALFKQVKKVLTEKYGTRQSETFKGDPSADWHLVNPGENDGIAIHLSVHNKNRQKRLKLEYVNEPLRRQYPDAANPVPATKAVDDGL